MWIIQKWDAGGMAGWTAIFIFLLRNITIRKTSVSAFCAYSIVVIRPSISHSPAGIFKKSDAVTLVPEKSGNRLVDGAMKIIGEGYRGKRQIGEMHYYKCSECGAEYTDIADANACQVKHFDDRQKKRKLESHSLGPLDVPSIRTKPKISIGKTNEPLPPEDEASMPALAAPPNKSIELDRGGGGDVDDEDDLQGLADRLLEQYKEGT